MDINLLVDSGAYSSWARKVKIDLDEYAAYLRYNSEHYTTAVNLDVIPGDFGRVPTALEVEVSAQQGWDNYRYLEDMGIHTKPVFHQGEQFKWLDKMIDHGIEYIGISPANDRTTKQKQVWLDEVFNRVVDKDGYPIIKTHGFGMTSIPLLSRYPWYSADSTSWLLFGAYGMVLMPEWLEDEYTYTKSPNAIFVSFKAKSVNQEGKHFNTLPSSVQEKIVAYIESHDLTLEQIQNEHTCRATLNASFYREVGRRNVLRPFFCGKRGFFTDKPDYKRKSLRWDSMKFVFATSDNAQHNTILNNLGIKDRLLSYFYIKESANDFLQQYATYGIYNRKKRRVRLK